MTSRDLVEVVDLTNEDDRRFEPLVVDLISDDELPNPAKTQHAQTTNQRNLHPRLQRDRKIIIDLESAPVLAPVGGTNLGASGTCATSNTKGKQTTFSSVSQRQANLTSEPVGHSYNEHMPRRSKDTLSAHKPQAATRLTPLNQQASSKTVETHLPKSQNFTKPFRLHCTECTQAELECDGEKPCSRCAEPGFDCRYPGDPLPKLKPSKALATMDNESTATEPRPVQTRKVESALIDRSSSSELSSRYSEAPDELDHKNARSKKVVDIVATNHHQTNKQGELPPCDWEPSSYEDVKDLVQVARQNMDMQREYWLQATLLESANRARQTALHPSTKPKENPFRRLLSTTKQPTRPQSERKTVAVYRGSIVTTANRRTISFIPMELGWDERQPVLPPYKSIGRMGSMFVAKNIHTIKHLPYFPDDELEENRIRREKFLRQRYRNGGLESLEDIVKGLVGPRACLERVHSWSIPFLSLLEALKLTPEKLMTWACTVSFSAGCEKCGLNYVKPKTVDSVTPLPISETRKCDWLYKACLSVLNIPIWHFLEEKLIGQSTARASSVLIEQKSDTKPSLCVICCVPNCAAHGLYEDGGRKRNAHRKPLINDPEIENNTRKALVSTKKSDENGHICGLYCTGDETKTFKYSDLYGLDDEGKLTGVHNVHVKPVTSHTGFKDLEPCDKLCSLRRSNREHLGELFSAEKARQWLHGSTMGPKISFLQTRTKLFGSSMRLPCSVARTMRIDCISAFKMVVDLHKLTAHLSKHGAPRSIPQGPKKAYQVKAAQYGSRELKEPFAPCSHHGPCKKENGCSCAEREGHCEHSCGCDKSCYRRFPGCTCEGPCFDNPAKCLCFKLGRECDPWVCGSCGVVEVLDPSNKYNEEIRIGRCKNNRMQLALPARTVKGSSQIQGWGLFAGEDMPKSTYIGEYKGEIVTRGEMQEAGRRGMVYKQGGQEYLFDLNSEQELDGSRFGNKTRFINHTSETKVINLRSVRQIVNGISRISFWTARDIKAGEEFFYDYGYEEETTKNFWDIHADMENLDPLLPIPKPVLTVSGTRRANEAGFGSDSESDGGEGLEGEDESSSHSSPEPAAPTKNQAKGALKRKADDADESRSNHAPTTQRVDPRRIAPLKTTKKPTSRQNSERRDASPVRRNGTRVPLRGTALKSLSDDGTHEDEQEESDDEHDIQSATSVSEAEIDDSEDDDAPLTTLKLKSKPKSQPLPRSKQKGRLRLGDKDKKTDKRKGGEAQRKAQETRRKNREKLGL